MSVLIISEERDYFAILLDKEFGFIGTQNELSQFPRISEEWKYCSEITNAIIDIDQNSLYNVVKAITKLNTVNCQHLEIRCFDDNCAKTLSKAINAANALSFRSIDLLMSENLFVEKGFEELCLSMPVVTKIRIFSTTRKWEETKKMSFTRNHIKSCENCGVVNPNFFSTSISHVNEAKKYNTCLHRKVSVDNRGFIKNCPSMKVDFGHISESNINDTIRKKKFLKLGRIKKEEIDVCKICEYRLICTDCRAYTDNQQNLYSRPKKCSYNPYIGKWEHEVGYLPLTEIGADIENEGFLVDHDKVADINKSLWGE